MKCRVWCKYSSGTQMTVHRAFLEWLERDFSSQRGLIASGHGVRRGKNGYDTEM